VLDEPTNGLRYPGPLPAADGSCAGLAQSAQTRLAWLTHQFDATFPANSVAALLLRQGPCSEDWPPVSELL